MTRAIVADDDEGMRTAVLEMLQHAGFDAIACADGAAALRALRQVSADLIICDLFMPGLDGLELIREIRRELPDLKIIAMSGGGFGGAVDLLTTARILGATEVLPKPFTRRKLLDAVERALRSSTDEG